MKQPLRSDIQNFAEESFVVRRERIANEYGEKRRQALLRVAGTGNSGGYLPALIAVEAECVRTMIIARSDADIEAFTLYGVPPDIESEVTLKAFGQQIVGGSISGIYGEMQFPVTVFRSMYESPTSHKPVAGIANASGGRSHSLQRRSSRNRVLAGLPPRCATDLAFDLPREL